MNITRIGTNYTPIRQAQKVNFGDINVSPLIKEYCALSDADIKKLNKRCPKCLTIKVDEHDSYSPNCKLAQVNVSIDGQEPSTEGKFNIFLDSWAIGENKREFMKEVITTIKMYN